MLFSVKFQQWGLPCLPAGGMYDLAEGPSFLGLLRHLVMPTFVLSIVSLAAYVRYLRASMLDVLQQDYVRTARAKGLDDRRIVWIHAFKNAALPLVTLIAMNIPRIFSGALITEQVFAWPGMGRLFVDHATRVDYPVSDGARDVGRRARRRVQSRRGHRVCLPRSPYPLQLTPDPRWAGPAPAAARGSGSAGIVRRWSGSPS